MLEQLSPVRIIEKEPNRHVEIHARHLGATLIVRQVGNYLTFSARLPHDIAEQGSDREGLQLCVKGCPLSERIDVAKVLNREDPIQRSRFHRNSAGMNGMNRVAALVLCREYNLTDSYLVTISLLPTLTTFSAESRLHLATFLYISLHFSTFLYISLHFSTFLYISLHFSTKQNWIKTRVQ